MPKDVSNNLKEHISEDKNIKKKCDSNFGNFLLDIVELITKNLNFSDKLNQFKAEQIEKIKILFRENEQDDKSSYTKSNTVNSNSLSKNKQKIQNKNTFNKKLSSTLSSTLKPINNLAP